MLLNIFSFLFAEEETVHLTEERGTAEGLSLVRHFRPNLLCVLHVGPVQTSEPSELQAAAGLNMAKNAG